MNAMANNMSQLHGHWSITKTKTTSPRECHFCGGYTYKSCAICLVPLCTSSIRATKQKTSKKSKTLSSRSDCHHNYHNPALAGLAKFDSSTSKFKYNAKKIKERLKQQQNLYEQVISERNLYSKQLLEAKEDITSMKILFRSMNHGKKFLAYFGR